MTPHAHQHIAPRGYLAPWAVDGMISCHFVDSGQVKPVSTRDAAVRTHFYSVRNPDGTHNVAFEQRLGEFEGKAVPLLRSIEGDWPLQGHSRAIVSEFIALQIVRGPVWRERMRKIGLATLEEHKAAKPHLTPEQWSQVEEANLSQHGVLDFMASQLDKLGTLVGSMHWTLLSFKTPRLATCDHPVSMIDINVFHTKVDPAVFPQAGMLSAVEIRFPISPTHGLLLSWLDGEDLIRSRAWAGLQENFNYATCRQAERQWFSRPGERIAHSEKVYPLLTQLTNPTYSLDVVTASPRRQKVLEIIHEKIEHDHSPGVISIVESVRAHQARPSR